MISVIIPALNRAMYVSRAIDSVLAQKYTDYEIIVVDDGSTDDTRKVLAPYLDTIHYIYEPNRGVSAARNTGIRSAQGEWIAFLDSDDRWLPTKLQRQMECIRDTGADVCFTRSDPGEDYLRPIRADGVKTSTPAGHRLAQDPLRLLLLESGGLFVQTMLIERDLLQRIGGFDESLRVAEDTRLIYTLAFLVPFGFVDEPLVVVERSGARGGLINGSFETSWRLCEAHVSILTDACSRYLGKDRLVRSALRSELAFALAKQAQLACAKEDYTCGRRLARASLHYRGDLRTFLRSLAVCVMPGLMGSRCRKRYT
jgi:glycosyltransferase involved in cell wall biosynthesis